MSPKPAEPEGSPPVHTKFSRGLLLLALGTGAFGLALGNVVLLALAASVAAFLHAARVGWPGSGAAGLALHARRVPRTSTVEVEVQARATSGSACLWLHAPLPTVFALERGSNVTLVEPGGALRERFAARCPRRGAFQLEGATLTAVHPHLLAPAALVAASPPAEVVVDPRAHPLRRVREPRVRASQPWGEDRGILGAGGAEFRELREYRRGDPLRNVNWKATARRSVDHLALMVNEHEPEARRNVWFFLDLSRRMEVGTSVENALEDAIDATLALASYYIRRGYRVGGTTFNAPPLVFYPDGGARQGLAIARGLAHAEAGDLEEGLPAAVERVRGFLGRERPQVFVVTRPELDPEGLLAGALRVHAYAARRPPRPVVAFAPQPPPTEGAEALAQTFLALEARAILEGSPALRVVPLAQGMASLELALAKGVPAR